MIDIRKYAKIPYARGLKSKSRQQEIIEFVKQIFCDCHFTDDIKQIPDDAILIFSEYIEGAKAELFFWIPSR